MQTVPLVRARQEQLEADVRRTCPDHPIRTREVHGRARPSNPFQIKSKRKNVGGGESRTIAENNRYYCKREKAKRPGSSFEFPGRRIFMVLNNATSCFADCRKPSRGRSSGSLRWTRIESIFRSVCPNLDNVSSIICSPMSSPTSRGVCTVKRRRFNDLGEMKACLQSRCSPS